MKYWHWMGWRRLCWVNWGTAGSRSFSSVLCPNYGRISHNEYRGQGKVMARTLKEKCGAWGSCSENENVLEMYKCACVWSWSHCCTFNVDFIWSVENKCKKCWPQSLGISNESVSVRWTQPVAGLGSAGPAWAAHCAQWEAEPGSPNISHMGPRMHRINRELLSAKGYHKTHLRLRKLCCFIVKLEFTDLTGIKVYF